MQLMLQPLSMLYHQNSCKAYVKGCKAKMDGPYTHFQYSNMENIVPTSNTLFIYNECLGFKLLPSFLKFLPSFAHR